MRYTLENCPHATVGRHSYGNPQILHFGEPTRLHIGNFCSIAGNVTIFLGGNHRVDWLTTYPFNVLFKDCWPEVAAISGHPYSDGDVVIGNDVWVGYGSTVLSGVSIGDGAVIAAGSMVTKDVSPYQIVAGNPAKPIRSRFDQPTVDILLRLRWWDWPDDAIRRHVHTLCSGDIRALERMAEGKGDP